MDEDNSESDDDEFTGKGVVFDSDEEEEVCFVHICFCFYSFHIQGPSDENLTSDKIKVLKFFNEGGEQEMTGIQVGCR